jgi:predicted metalloprotease with PDZ domain
LCDNARRPRPPRRIVLIKYRVRVADLDRHLFEIDCRIDDPAPDQRFTLPAWIPGSYLLREFARFVVGIEASSGGRALPVEKTESSAWLVRGAGADLTLTIKVYALDQSVRGAYLDRRRAYFNGPCVFVLPDGRDAQPIEVTLERPTNLLCEGWRVATALERADANDEGFGVYRAADYDELLDHPVEIGLFESVEFEAAGVPHHLVVAGRFESDLERVAADLKQLCEAQIEFFGRPAPFNRYWFLCLTTGGDGWGGLEHRASTSLIFGRDDLPKAGEAGVPRDYQRFLALASHEYFHTWHVKRTKPAAFMPYRLDRRAHTRQLWVFEGITSYYQEVMLLRSGVIGVPEDGFEKLAIELGGAELERFFSAAVRGTEDLPMAELLAAFGVRLEFRAAVGPEDKGGTPRSPNGELLSLGISFREHANGVELTAVVDGGAAQRAGLNPGDVLIAVDRLKVSDRNLKRRLARFEAGERITASVFRGDELLEVGLVMRAALLDTAFLALDEQATAEAAQRRGDWLGA